MAEITAVHPVLNVRDVRASAEWYAKHLGFEGRFADSADEPGYGGIGRDRVELHLQWHSAEEWAENVSGNVYRFLVDDPDLLFEEIANRSGVLDGREVSDTDWNTREFGLYDPDGNALFFYRDLVGS